MCRTEYTNILPRHNRNRLVNKQSIAPTRRAKEYLDLIELIRITCELLGLEVFDHCEVYEQPV